MTKRIQVGTSGWHYTHWKGRFYPPDVRAADRLNYYAAHFDIFELNNTFYRLPAEAVVDENRLQLFLEVLPPGNRYAFEFRDPSWNTKSVYKLLARFHAAYCIFDLAGFQSPLELTADFTYVRLHGPGRRYEGSYDDSTLRSWAKRLREWDLTAAYVFFDNDQAAYAPRNAIRLQSLLRE